MFVSCVDTGIGGNVVVEVKEDASVLLLQVPVDGRESMSPGIGGSARLVGINGSC